MEEVGSLLDCSGFKKLRPIFAENEVTGMRLWDCESYEDLMTEDFGVGSKPVAKDLMRRIEAWRLAGV